MNDDDGNDNNNNNIDDDDIQMGSDNEKNNIENVKTDNDNSIPYRLINKGFSINLNHFQDKGITPYFFKNLDCIILPFRQLLHIVS